MFATGNFLFLKAPCTQEYALQSLEPAFGLRHLREHGSEVPEEKSDRDAEKHRIPAELAKHCLSGFCCRRDSRVECLDEVVPEAMEKGGRPDAAGRKPDPCKERRAADQGEEEQHHRGERSIAVGTHDHQRQVPEEPDDCGDDRNPGKRCDPAELGDQQPPPPDLLARCRKNTEAKRDQYGQQCRHREHGRCPVRQEWRNTGDPPGAEHHQPDNNRDDHREEPPAEFADLSPESLKVSLEREAGRDRGERGTPHERDGCVLEQARIDSP